MAQASCKVARKIRLLFVHIEILTEDFPADENSGGAIDFYNNNSTEKLNAQYTEVRISPEAYKNIRVDDESCLLDFRYSGSVCVNSRVNEIKFGISCGLDPGKDYVEVHKTCYFDSYLTKIILGRELVSSVDGEITAGTENFLPYMFCSTAAAMFSEAYTEPTSREFRRC